MKQKKHSGVFLLEMQNIRPYRKCLFDTEDYNELIKAAQFYFEWCSGEFDNEEQMTLTVFEEIEDGDAEIEALCEFFENDSAELRVRGVAAETRRGQMSYPLSGFLAWAEDYENHDEI